MAFTPDSETFQFPYPIQNFKNRSPLVHSENIPAARDIRHSIILELNLFLANFTIDLTSIKTGKFTPLPFTTEINKKIIQFHQRITKSEEFSPLEAREVIEIIRRWQLATVRFTFIAANDDGQAITPA
ncbi:hypothetical protein KBB08_02525 [Candidatus Gracilibacteria bacterium]|nr:hypothetical protein [Candidatus Gracilibacteria bacterium]